MSDASGLIYLRARYYNPATATFLSRDPFPGYAHLALSRNGYSYVHGNPINYVDPSGETRWLQPGARSIYRSSVKADNPGFARR